MQVFTDNQQEDLKISLKSVEDVYLYLLENSQISCLGLSVCLVDKQTIEELHLLYFDDPSFTDCITVPYETSSQIELEELGFLGEVYLCPLAAIEYSRLNGVDPYQELKLYCVHTFLHLLGMEDQTESGANAMREAESYWLQMLDKEKKHLCP